MDPNQQPSKPQEGSQFDFIMNPAAAPKKVPLASSSLPTRILVVVVGLFVLLLVITLFIKLLGGAGGGVDKAAMLNVAQDQTELARVADSGTTDAVSQATQNFAINAKLTANSQQTNLLSYLATKSYKPNVKDLSLKQSATTDTELASAKSSSTYDPTYKTVMQGLLSTYQKDLKTAYTSASPSGKSVLKKDYNGTQLLQTELDSL